MPFINVKHWPTLNAKLFQEQYVALGASEPAGLWFRGLGNVGDEGVLVAELWSDRQSWHRMRDEYEGRQDVKQARARYAERPASTVREEVTAAFVPDGLYGHPRSSWIELAEPGGILVIEYPQATEPLYRSGIENVGLREGAPAADGLLCAADGPLDRSGWVLLRMWQPATTHQEAVESHRNQVRKLDKAGLHQESNLTHVYVTSSCPTGSHNTIAPGLFL